MQNLAKIIAACVAAKYAAAKITVINAAYGGRTSWHKGKVVEIEAPLGKGAEARTVRIHELLHANRPKGRDSKKHHPIAINAIADCFLHLFDWSKAGLPKRAHRDACATALRNIRVLCPDCIQNANAWNLALLQAIRGFAILQGASYSAVSRDYYRSHRFSELASAHCGEVFGEMVYSELKEVLFLCQRRKKKQAIELFMSLMLSDEPTPPNGDKGADSTNDKCNSPMRVKRLPLVCASTSAVRRQIVGRVGSRLHRPGLITALASGNCNSLFKRQAHLPGGSVLIDASGSMHLTEDDLQKLLETSPMATVGYYSGFDGRCSRGGCFGQLTIYSANGRRAVGLDNDGARGGSNNVDLWAIDWLLQQAAPRTYIGDGKFCGGPENQAVRAELLMRQAVLNGAVTWVNPLAV